MDMAILQLTVLPIMEETKRFEDRIYDEDSDKHPKQYTDSKPVILQYVFVTERFTSTYLGHSFFKTDCCCWNFIYRITTWQFSKLKKLTANAHVNRSQEVFIFEAIGYNWLHKTKLNFGVKTILSIWRCDS